MTQNVVSKGACHTNQQFVHKLRTHTKLDDRTDSTKLLSNLHYHVYPCIFIVMIIIIKKHFMIYLYFNLSRRI